MALIDSEGFMDQFLTDKKRKIPKAHLISMCLLTPRSKKTCRYLCLTALGFICAKKTPMKVQLDDRVKNNTMNAQGDNCEGLGD